MSKVDLSQVRIAVLAGGPGSEREVSLASGRAVAEALATRAGEVALVELSRGRVEWEREPDLAFNVVHGTYGEDGQLQRELEGLGVPYTGAGPESSELAFDKFRSKARFLEQGVRTPFHERLPVSEALSRGPSLGFPLVVKPPREGSSVGVHIVETEDAWQAAVEDAGRFGDELLVEECIRGKELTVGILENEALPVVHIQPRSGFYDMKNKYPWLCDDGGTDYFCPADLPAEVTKAVQREALAAHRALGVEIYSRVDLLLDEEGQAFVLEVNTIPGMTSSSLLPKAARAAGVEFDALCAQIAQASLDLRSGKA